jgi:hypothetical protein
LSNFSSSCRLLRCSMLAATLPNTTRSTSETPTGPPRRAFDLSVVSLVVPSLATKIPSSALVSLLDESRTRSLPLDTYSTLPQRISKLSNVDECPSSPILDFRLLLSLSSSSSRPQRRRRRPEPSSMRCSSKGKSRRQGTVRFRAPVDSSKRIVLRLDLTPFRQHRGERSPLLLPLVRRRNANDDELSLPRFFLVHLLVSLLLCSPSPPPPQRPWPLPPTFSLPPLTTSLALSRATCLPRSKRSNPSPTSTRILSTAFGGATRKARS